jgi:signal transduction histidine kinase
VWACALAAAVGVAASTTLALTNDTLVRPGLQAALVDWVVVPYVVSGLLAWSRRPASRLGPLMLATGFVLILITLQWSANPVLFSIGHLLDLLPAAMILHVYLAFPTGRLTHWPEQILVAAGYATVTLLQLAKVLLGVNPDNLLAVTSSPTAETLENVELILLSALLLAAAVLLLVRRRHDYRPTRRSVALLVDAFGLSLVMLAVLYVAGMAGWPQVEAIRNVTFVALGLAPVVFLAGLLDERSQVRVLEAGRQERQRLERDLHDGAQQRLVALSLELSLLSDDPATDRETRDRLVRARGEVTESLRELRELARGTYPAVLSGHGLAVALESLAARAPVPLSLHTDVDGRLSEPVEAAAYYLVSESLANIGKHAHAGAATVRVAESSGVLRVEVSDDGVGGADTGRGSGLRGLADRVATLGGTLHIASPAGGGTRLRAEIPCR